MIQGPRRIALLCARPPERNTGMVTVDLAGLSFLRRRFHSSTITPYVWGVLNPYKPDELPFVYHDLLSEADDFIGADLRIVWGDFSHAAAHWLPDPKAWPGETVDVSPAKVAEIAFLQRAELSTIRRTIVFGATIITNEAKDYRDRIYDSASRRFFTEAGAVFFRDALSAAKIAADRGAQQTLGIDCAFTLRDEDLEQLPRFVKAPSKSGIGVFFGRSPDKPRLLSFARQLGNKLGEKPTWLHWFWSSRRVRIPARVHGFSIANSEFYPGELLSALSACRFVVTDTYHLCINAWRMGIPAICVGMGASTSSDSLADKKKEILYEMYDAREFYVFGENLKTHSGKQHEITRAAAALRDPWLIAKIINNIERQRIAAEQRFDDALSGIFSQITDAT